MSLRTLSKNAPLLAALATAAGCDPPLPLPADIYVTADGGLAVETGSGGGAITGPGGGLLLVTAEPPATIEAAPNVLRLRAALPGLALDPTRFVLVQGTLGLRQTHEFYTGNVSATLTQRIVDTLTWSEGSAEVMAPTAPLQAGATYTLIMADIPAAMDVQIASLDNLPLLTRLWPPEGASGTASFAVWCGADVVPRVDTTVVPAPAGPPGRIRRGAVTAGAGERCLRFEADDAGDSVSSVAVPPPVVASAEDPRVVMRLDPRPLRFDAPPAPLPPLACEPGEVTFGPGCARIMDDRIYGRSPEAPLLWAVAGAGTDSVIAAAAGDPFVIAGLPPATEVTLDVAAIDSAGAVRRTLLTATTLPPMPHVVLNEVLAHPFGPEPAQEWVEIVNDGPAPAELGGYVLLVGNGTTPLPSATLPPGAFALIVTETYMAAGGPDVAPPPGTLLLTVPHIGKAGLSNEGEALSLIDGDGNTVSAFPASPKPKQGSSVARKTPSAPDALLASFALAVPSPGRTNAW